MDEYTQAKCRAAENAALLVCLREQPSVPKENKQPACGTQNELTLRREVQLIEDFAFISSTKDDPNGVTAVCMEIDQDGSGVTFRVAANNGCLLHITQELQKVADLMMRASRHDVSRDTATQLLFEQVTRMCFARILSRLRSKHAAKSRKTRDKPQMPSLLVRAISQCKLQCTTETSRDTDTASQMRKQCKELADIFQRLENSNDNVMSLQYVTKILLLARHLDTRTLAKILNQSRLTDPSLKDYLPKAIEKLGRYRIIAEGLISASKTTKHSLFRRITVHPIGAPITTSDDGALAGALGDFEAVWLKSASKAAHHLSQRLRENTKKKYGKHILGSRKKWKVHAEVQILCFYEQRPHHTLPRAICASKSACYLCNLLLEVHGRFFVPRTHGRIYDRWTLPSNSYLGPETVQRLLPVIHRFNRAVEMTLIRALRGEICHYAPPNESLLAVYEPSSSFSTIVPQRGVLPSPLVEEHASSPGELDNGCLLPVDNSTEIPRTGASSSVLSVSIQSGHATYFSFLQQGEQVCKDLEQGDHICVQTSAIHLQFSWSSNRSADAARSQTAAESYRIRVEYLWNQSELACDARKVDVDHLRYDQNEVICFDRASRFGRIVCHSGEHSVCLTFEEVSRAGVTRKI